MADRSFNILSLCSGYGGLDLGVELALGGAARVVCGVEREATCAGVLAEAMGAGLVPAFPVWSDLRTFDGRAWRGVVDCITGGYPCQPFSFAGKRRGQDDPRHLWPAIARIVSEVQPGVVFFENVSGHLSLGFPAVRRELESLGFRVTAGLFTAEEVGAPHKRERLFILGVADDHAERGEQVRWSATGGGQDADRHGGELADSIVARRSPPVRRGRINQRNKPESRCDGLADTWGERPQGLGAEGPASRPDPERWKEAPDGIDDLHTGVVPLFPPGPGSAEWRRILAAGGRPDLAPATQPRVRGVDDGGPGRLDRLRMLGNGVVPLCAAYAFVALWACLRGDE